MFKLAHLLPKCSRTCNVILPNLVKVNTLSSVSTLAEAKSIPTSNETSETVGNVRTKPKREPASVKSAPNTHGDMVAAVFASLKSESVDNSDIIKTPFTDDRISKAQTVNELLSISTGSGVSRRHALKVVSLLADWSSTGKVRMSDFENDPRFIRLCRTLTKSHLQKPRNSVVSRSEDLSTILSVTADDEAAKLVGSITLSQMVKVLSTLSQKKRRSTLLLRALSYNITASPEKLDLKQSADILYSISILNFLDENLLVKLSNDICSGLRSNVKKSSVIGSIITSLGLMRYKDTELLDELSEWILKHHTMCRPQDVFSLFMTLAVLNHSPSNADDLYKELLPLLTQEEAGKPLVWLEIVWSLALLNRATEEQISSVLCDSFIKKLEDSKAMSLSTKLKVINIDAVATYLMNDYKGSRITDNTNVRNVQIGRTKEKMEVVNMLIDSLKNLIQSDTHIATNVNTGAGFYIDAKLIMDEKCNPLPLSTQGNDPGINRIAIVAQDYHDMCRGQVEPLGINVFAYRVMENMGFKVLIVPYTEFNIGDKVVHRVKYLESKLKEVVQS